MNQKVTRYKCILFDNPVDQDMGHELSQLDVSMPTDLLVEVLALSTRLQLPTSLAISLLIKKGLTAAHVEAAHQRMVSAKYPLFSVVSREPTTEDYFKALGFIPMRDDEQPESDECE